jgi:hypothetical protein
LGCLRKPAAAARPRRRAASVYWPLLCDTVGQRKRKCGSEQIAGSRRVVMPVLAFSRIIGTQE